MSTLPRGSLLVFFLMIRRPPRSTLDRSSAASDVYKRQTYTNPNSQADRPEFILDWGDNTPLDTIQRDSATLVQIAGINTQRNLYIHTHVYPGPGVFLLQYIDPNRVADVCLLYTSDAADERSSVDLGGRRIIKKKKKHKQVGDRDRIQ